LAVSGTVASLPISSFGILSQKQYDIVIHNGRVIDPETKTDAIRNVAISGNTILAITPNSIRGKKEIDAKGLVVSPGFIDPIAHGQDEYNDRLQILDGVTTSLQMEGGAEDVANWYQRNSGKRHCNFGAGAGHGHARSSVLKDNDDEVSRAATPDEVKKICAHIEKNLKAGGLGVGFGLEYRPSTTRWEVIEAFQVAAKYKASCHCHTRYGTLDDDFSALVGFQEVMATAMATGAPLHICHVPSMALSSTSQALEFIAKAQRRGFDVTCDFYPYTAFGTGIASEVFAGDWQKKFGITYGDVEWALTHERLTKESFDKYRAEGGFVIAHAIPEAAVRAAVSSPITMVGSDGRIREGAGHPRTSGTFCRVLGHYSRDSGLLTLNQAIEKMTLKTVKRFERRCPAFKKKGRVQVGCDADLTIFDPKTVIDRATFDKPAETSVGVQFVIVNGSIAVSEGKIVEGVKAGKGVRAAVVS
jgi:dihydroorotase